MKERKNLTKPDLGLLQWNVRTPGFPKPKRFQAAKGKADQFRRKIATASSSLV